MKPHVICHMMAPLDGRLIVADWSPSTGHTEEELVAEYDRTHEAVGADAWLSGRKTGEEFSDGIDGKMSAPGEAERPVRVATSDAEEYAVIVDKDARLVWKKAEIGGAHLIVLLCASVPDDYLAALTAAGASYIVSPADEIDLFSALDILASRFGIKRLMLEGGARTNGEFLKLGLVDEITYVLFPAIGAKSGTPAIVEAGEDGISQPVRLKMTSCTPGPLDNLHIRYDIVR
jgi:riboflavin biosynthesis pyrimidine reductase